MQIHVDGDFPVGGAKCKYYCSPTCHPAQIGPNWRYGCLHPAWPANQERDFCPIVFCGGDPEECEIPLFMLTRAEEEELFGAD